jgi:hypothetical protein
MTLLHVGAPVVRQSVFGDWLIDDGGIVPIRAGTCERAFEEAAARTLNSLPAGDLEPAVGSVATPGGVGMPDSQPFSAAVGCVPGPFGLPKSPGPGAPNASSARRHGAGGLEEVLGVAVEVPSPPPDASLRLSGASE